MIPQNNGAQKYGFVYLWLDKTRKRYYVGSHWGDVNDGYICSSQAMRDAHRRRPNDFKRKVLKYIYTSHSKLLDEEQRWLDMIKADEFGRRYYNVSANVHKAIWWLNDTTRKLVIKKLKKPKSKLSAKNYSLSNIRQPRGYHLLSPEEKSVVCKKAGNGTRITFEQRSKGGKTSGNAAVINKTGIHSLSIKEKQKISLKGKNTFLEKMKDPEYALEHSRKIKEAHAKRKELKHTEKKRKESFGFY